MRDRVGGVGQLLGQLEIRRRIPAPGQATVGAVSDPSPPSAAETAKVLRSYLRDGRLTVMPRGGASGRSSSSTSSSASSRAGATPEAEVNLILREVWDDVAALRRYLVDAALLERAGGEYWRIGGPVEV